MVTNYEKLTDEDRATIMVFAQEGKSLRAMARPLHRAPPTISRKWRRHAAPEEVAGTRGYDANRPARRRDIRSSCRVEHANWR